MEQPPARQIWTSGEAYEAYMGRWSSKVAAEFLGWLGQPPARRWLDVGCGTGALCRTVLEQAAPAALVGIDRSAHYVAYARGQIGDRRAVFASGAAQALPLAGGSFEVVISGLMLNFVPEPVQAVAEMRRVARPGATVAVYVWDYQGEMQMLRHFWQTVIDLDPAASQLVEGNRFTICRPEPLARVFEEAGLQAVTVEGLEVPTLFKNFDDFWTPLQGGQGPAAGYVAALSPARREVLAQHLRDALPVGGDGSITLKARAWAVRGLVPG